MEVNLSDNSKSLVVTLFKKNIERSLLCSAIDLMENTFEVIIIIFFNFYLLFLKEKT